MASLSLRKIAPATAWAVCRGISSLAAVDLDTLCLALQHAAAIDVAGSARTMADAASADRVLASRLFVELQLRLARADQSGTTVDEDGIQALIRVLPECWAHALSARLQGVEVIPLRRPALPAATAAISDNDLLTVLAIRRASSRG